MDDRDVAIEMASSWVLRIGLVLSMLIMVIGTVVSFLHGRLPLTRMQHAKFESAADIWHGLLEGRGQAIVELGIYLLVLTPIMRVVASIILFAVAERDWLYVAITFVTLLLTLTGLLILK